MVLTPGHLAPGNGLHARQQLAHFHRFDQVVIGANLQAQHFLIERITRRQHDHRQAVTALAQAPQQRLAAELGQVQVQQQQVIVRLAQQLVSGVATVHMVHHKGMLAQQPGQGLGQFQVVFDQKDLHRRGWRTKGQQKRSGITTKNAAVQRKRTERVQFLDSVPIRCIMRSPRAAVLKMPGPQRQGDTA